MHKLRRYGLSYQSMPRYRFHRLPKSGHGTTRSPSDKHSEENDPKKSVSESSLETTSPKKSDSEHRKARAMTAVQFWIKQVLDGGIDGMKKDFAICDEMQKNELYHGTLDDERNRYRDIGCIERTRVKLNNTGKDSDYIHANFIHSGKMKARFICTQAPLDATIEDFWRMICQTGSQFIVMLCDLLEGNVSVCAEYWPRSSGQRMEFGTVEVKNSKVTEIEATDENKKFKAIKSELRIMSNLGPHQCTHFYWPEWGDQQPPPSFNMLRRIAREVRFSRKPITVHCTTGVGRSASFIAIELVLEMLNAGIKCNMLNILNSLRKQRAKAVNSWTQYVGIHMFVMQYFDMRGKISEKDRKRADEFMKHCSASI